MKIINLSSIANPISISVQNPSRSDYDRFIGLEHYDSGEPVITRFQGTELLTTSAKAFKANDILIARRNVYLKRAGIVFFDGITSGDSIILRLKEDTQKTIGYSREDLIRYIPFMLNSEHFWIYANKHADGMNSKRISKDTLLEYEFELPSIDEMRDISDKLWAAYRLKEAYKKLLVTTDEMVKSQFIEMVGDPRNNPKGWPTKRLSELAEYSIGLTYKPEQICDDGTIVLRSGNIQDGKISFSDIVRVNAPIKESLFVKEDDILMCSRNGSASLVGKVAMIPDINEPMTFGAFMTIIRSAEAKYLYLYFQSQDFRERVSEGKSSTMNQITQKMLDKVEVPFPDKDVRETLSAIASQADKSKFELRKSIDAIDKVIKSLINN